jgi:hypothetical protein
MTPEELDRIWNDLPSPLGGEFNGRRVPGMPLTAPVYVAIDGARTRQLLVSTREGEEPLRSSATRGLEVSTDELRISGAPAQTYMRLVCVSAAHHATFAALCDAVITGVLHDPDNRRTAVIRCLERWRSFWVMEQTGLTREEVLGLFGELWFFNRWCSPRSLSTVARWVGPTGARHDFQWPVASIECKASASASGSAAVHCIGNLDQLADAETGHLYLFSLHVAEDSLAANSLPILIERITADLAREAEALSLFLDRLSAAGYNPADAGRYTRSFRILSEELYRVDSSFPRLTRDSFQEGLPSGIGDISYTLSMSACRPWRVATSPRDVAAAFLRE